MRLGTATARLRHWRGAALLALLVLLSPAVPYGAEQLAGGAQRPQAAALIAGVDQPVVLGSPRQAQAGQPLAFLIPIATPADTDNAPLRPDAPWRFETAPSPTTTRSLPLVGPRGPPTRGVATVSRGSTS